MPRISTEEYLAQPFRVHAFLAGEPLHDVWAVDLPAVGGCATLREFRSRTKSWRRAERLPVAARGLIRMRLVLGRMFGWDREPNGCEAFAERLTAEDRERSSIPAGEREGMFHAVYSFANEQLVELSNRTVHAAALSGLTETATGYRFYFAIYVRRRGWITPLYMAAIDPFRKWIIYPAILRQIASDWRKAYGVNAQK